MGGYRGQGKIPVPYIIFTSGIGIKLFVGSASPRGIRKAHEMGEAWIASSPIPR